MSTSETLTIPVSGMTCGGCVASVERAVRRVDSVAEVMVTLTPGSLTVTFTPGVMAQRDAVVQAVEDAGFQVG